jgi:uncharacterized membrane protein YfcA
MARSRHTYPNPNIRPADRSTAPVIREAPEGVVSASLVVVILVATIIGAMVGLLLGAFLPPGSRSIAIPAGFIATVVASIARYKLLAPSTREGVDEARIPTVLVVNAAIASIAGSLTAHDLVGFIGAQTSPALLGALAGLLSAVLTALLMITYHTNPNPGPRR